MSRPRIVPLAAATGIGAGGKAEGLARLIALGHRVPPGFVVVDAQVDALPDELEAQYEALGRGRVAVRSSASDEDGENASFAGQHETILDVEGTDALRDAVRRCLASLDSDHAKAYRARNAGGERASMTVVVQRMVDASAAGVAFSVDPVSARRDRMIVDAVRGLGDALVSGHRTPDHHVLDRSGRLLARDVADGAPVLDDAQVESIGRAVRAIADSFGQPIDVEWAIDRAGALHLLQARPVTTLPADPRELDVSVDPTHVSTKCNIGEMMPGAATPLTWSTSARGIDYGMQRLYTEVGVQPRILDTPVYILQWFGHLFIDLSAMRAIGGGVAGASEEDVVIAICGREVPEVGKAERVPPLRRFANGIRYGRAVLSHRERIASLDRILASLRFGGDSAETRYDAIDAQLPLLLDAYYHHLVASMLSGALASAILATVAKGKAASPADHARVAELLAGAEGVESHDIAFGIDRIVEVALRVGAKDVLMSRDRASVRAYLESEAPTELRDAYRTYLERHGHRCVREVEMRVLEWAADPSPIVDAIVSGVAAAARGRRHHASAPSHEPTGRVLRMLVAKAHEGVRSREAAKSKLVAITARFKSGYRAFAAAAVSEGILPDADLVFFLTHEELGSLVRTSGARPRLVAQADARRRVLPFQMGLEFQDVFVGVPEPIVPAPPSGDRVLRGKPVSRGVVRGRARVARTLDEARLVEPGEILIAPITDVGWTPVFATIAGLATDIGSAVSHGAVVAREYGLPALVDTRVGTATFRTGELVELDADRGILRVIEASADGPIALDASR